MEKQHYNGLNIVLAEKELEPGSQSRWATASVLFQAGWPDQLYDIAEHLEVDVRELLVQQKKKMRLKNKA